MTTLYKSPFDSDKRLPPVIVIADIGNAYIKMYLFVVIDGKLKEYSVIMPHAIVNLKDFEWANEARVYSSNLSRQRAINTQIFKLRIRNNGVETWLPVKVGKQAMLSSENKPVYGAAKYQNGAIDVLLVAGLRELFAQASPEFDAGHDNIILGVGHPPTDIAYVDSLKDTLNATHVIETAQGKKAKYSIRAVSDFDEGIASMVYYMSRIAKEERARGKNGQFASSKLKLGDRITLFDAGGRKGSMGTIVYSGKGLFEVQYDTFKPIDGGMVTVREDMRDNLMNLLRMEFAGRVERGDLDDDLIDRIILTGQFRNYPKEKIEQAVTYSLGYLNRPKQTYETDFASGLLSDHLMHTGGTHRELHKHIEVALPHVSRLYVDTLANINMANLEGGIQIILSKLMDERLLPAVFQPFMQKMEIEDAS